MTKMKYKQKIKSMNFTGDLYLLKNYCKHIHSKTTTTTTTKKRSKNRNCSEEISNNFSMISYEYPWKPRKRKIIINI